MYINLSNIPEWVLENSIFLKTLKEDCIDEDENENELYYIPFLEHFDDTFDFSIIFQKDQPYLNLDNYILIYLDIFKFIDFIGFEIPFYKLIEPKDYKHISHILDENKKIYDHFIIQIKGVQHYAFHLKKFNHYIELFEHTYDFKNYDKYTHEIDDYIKESIENDDYDWLQWFIKNVNNLSEYEHLLFNFNYSNVSIKTFELLYNINKIWYSDISEYIVKYHKSELFIKYINEIKCLNETKNEKLLKLAFKRRYHENVISHMEFVKLMLNNGFDFKFIPEYSKNTYYSNNPFLMNYMYENYQELINKNVIDICPVLYSISLNDNICSFEEKIGILDFFVKKYNNVIKMEKLLHYIFSLNSKNDNLNKYEFDYNFISILIERTGNSNNIYSYMIYLYFNDKVKIKSYIESCKNNDDQSYDISKFKNTFKYVLSFKNTDYIDFYIKNKLYINDGFNEKQYLKSVVYDINLFKLIYKNKIGIIDLNDNLFIYVYENNNIQILLFMLQEKYLPSERVKKLIKIDYEQSLNVNKVEKNGVIEVTKYFTNSEFKYKEKVYKMIC